MQIPHTMYTLDNGLTVILHRDETQPMAVVNINVQVGSRDEAAGRTGFAHLFEHLMFMGTTRVPTQKYDQWMEAEGGWNNAWTSTDRTNYYDVAPSHALPLLLWMEADRMLTLGREIDQAKLDVQREVVRNERRQELENQPYGQITLRLPELLFTDEHPYGHPVIGSHEDIAAATVQDVRSFFAEHYVPSNASLVVAGDFDEPALRAQIERYFGGWEAKAAPIRRTPNRIPRLDCVVRETIEDQVTLSKIVMAWHSPALMDPGDAELDLVATLMSRGKSSRLYHNLVYEQRIAQSVSVYQASRKLSSYFCIQVTVRPGIDLPRVEAAVDVELQKLRDQAPEVVELERARMNYEMGLVSQLQSLENRASLLNMAYAETGDPSWATRDLERYHQISPESVQQTVCDVLDPNKRVILHVVPASETGTDGELA